MGKYYLECILKEEGINSTTYTGYSKEKKSKIKEKVLDQYLAYVFMKGVKCKPLIPSMKKHIDKLYETHKNKDIYPKSLAEAMQLHGQSYKDRGKKNKKKNRNEGNADENNGSEEATTETNNANNNNNQTGESRPTVTAHMHQEDDKELNDEEFEEALLVVARSGDNCFDMTESEDISSASVYSEESLGGAHF